MPNLSCKAVLQWYEPGDEAWAVLCFAQGLFAVREDLARGTLTWLGCIYLYLLTCIELYIQRWNALTIDKRNGYLYSTMITK